jgi:NADH dehydrogenase FAD-containing subunit
MPAHGSSILTSRRHRVVIVGAGFGGLFAAKALRGADADVTVIDRTNHHLFQPLLRERVVAAQLPACRSRTVTDRAARHRRDDRAPFP